LCRQNALGPKSSRDDWKNQHALGFVPNNVSQSVENIYADYCLSRLAEALGKKEDAELFAKKANTYRLLYCPENKCLRPKDKDGNWSAGWKGPLEKNPGFVECTPMQQTWSVPHDPAGLIALMGLDTFRSQLDGLFARVPEGKPWSSGYDSNYYNHANEPVHHVAYLFNYDGRPWLTQKWVRTICTVAYGTGPDGLCGQEDVGQMSAWFLLSSMGIYMVAPASDIWNIGSPLYKKSVIRLEGDRRFSIVAENNSDKNVYIQSATLNGKPLDRPWLKHEEIMAGGELKFVMGPQPSKWGSENPPPSFSKPISKESP